MLFDFKTVYSLQLLIMIMRFVSLWQGAVQHYGIVPYPTSLFSVLSS